MGVRHDFANFANMDTLRNTTFRKRERLSLKREIDALFVPGSKSFAAYPLRAVYRTTDYSGTEVKVMTSVSKRHFHHAVDRNRAKRQMREAYRLNKSIVVDAIRTANEATPDNRLSLNIAFIWLADEPKDSQLVERKLENLLYRISESLNPAQGQPDE